MTDRDKYSRSPSRSPTVQRSTSLSGARLHYNYTGSLTRTKDSRQEHSTPKLQRSNALTLPRQSTFDYSTYTSAQPDIVVASAPDSQRRIAYDEYDPKNRSKTESSVSYQQPFPSSLLEVPSHYKQSSAPRISSRTKDVTLATSSPSSSSSPQRLSLSVPSSEPRGAATNAPVTTRTNSVAMSYGNRETSLSSYSSYDSRKPVVPADTSPRLPAHLTTSYIPPTVAENVEPSSTLSTSQNAYPLKLQSLQRGTAPSAPPLPPRAVTKSSSPRPVHIQTEAQPYLVPSVQPQVQPVHPLPIQHLNETQPTSAPPVPPHTQIPQLVRAQPQPAPARHPSAIVRQSSVSTTAAKPQSLNSHVQMNQRSRTLNIGYSPQQRQDIEQAQVNFAETIRRQEAETKTRMEAEKATVEAARAEAMRKAREAAKRAEEFVAKQAAEAPQRSADNDEDVEKFIQRLEQQIKDSRDSKNGQGALAGRQTSPVALVESLTDAPKNEDNENGDEKEEEEEEDEEEYSDDYEGDYEECESDECDDSEYDDDDGDEDEDKNRVETAEGVADSSEEYSFLERIKNMKTDLNANRQKFSEKNIEYTDDEDADSEVHSSDSINSFLSTVTEEDADDLSSSLNNSTTDSQPDALYSSVISYIHSMVDDILSSLDKSDFEEYLDTRASVNSVNENFYANDASFNYYVISENAKQFFTPRTSAENEATDPACL